MGFFDFFLGQKKNSAQAAKDRLSFILMQERSDASSPDFLPQMQQELIAVISKYVKINPDDIKVQMDRQDNLEVLEVKIEIPPKPISE